ncbi:MAG: bifunctional metallophosphatase/5'-nucleotidase [Phycicoccus sp.]|nr:bifunctional metallophosphatase/5'-nucleotidase [Phycicoccus sp.]
MSFVRSRRLVGVLAVAMAAGVGIAGSSSPSMAGPKGSTLDIQILSFNDFHGNLEAPSGSSARVTIGHRWDAAANKPVDVNLVEVVDGKDVDVAGGVEYLATHLRNARAGHANSVTVAAGDIIGASPLLSAAFHDEPTIEAMNALGLEATAVGNHEFDEGYLELQRMQNGGCLDDGDGLNNQNSCATPAGFSGANFQMLAANVKYASNGKTILPSYWIKNFNGAKIGFIGMTLKGTPTIVTAAGVAGLEFTDEVVTANALVPVLREQGVKAIVVLIHQGGTPAPQKVSGPNNTSYNVNPTYDYTCGGGGTIQAGSPILPIAADLDPQIDLIISGHTHQPYVCNVPDRDGQPRLVTSASSFGRLFTETNLTFDRQTQDIVRASVTGSNMIVTRKVPKAVDETSIINTYKTLIAPVANRELGRITATLTRSSVAESTLGDFIADAQVNDPSVITDSKVPVVAFMNPGGIRTDLLFARTVGQDPANPLEATDGIVRYEEAFNVQPFNNYLVSMDMTGAEIRSLLAQQWSGGNALSVKFLQVSAGLHYTVTGSGLARVIDPLTIKDPVTNTYVDVNDATVYRIVTNNFLAEGGDNFTAFRNGTPRYFGGLDIDGFAKYMEQFTAAKPYAPAPVGNRITQ